MVSVYSYFIYKATGFLTNHYGSYFWILGWLFTIIIYIEYEIQSDTTHIEKNVTSNICYGRWPSNRAITIYTTVDTKINLLQSLVYILINLPKSKLLGANAGI